jgi:hypothetical protein
MHGQTTLKQGFVSFPYDDDCANPRLPPKMMFRRIQKCIQQIFMLSVRCIFPILTVNSSSFTMARLSVLMLCACKRPCMKLPKDANDSEMTGIRIEIRNINPRFEGLGHCLGHQVSWVLAWRRMRWTDILDA